MGRFTSAHLKIKRADKHIGDLESAFADFVKTEFYRFGVEKNPKGEDVLSFEVTTPIPEDIPMIIGDALHNLRTALDHVAHQVVADSGATPSKNLYFPFAKGREELVAGLRDGEIEAAAGQTLIDLIVDTVRPYKGGNDALYALHKADIGDKHKIGVPTITIAALFDVEVKVGGGTFHISRMEVGEGGKLNAIASAVHPIEIAKYGKAAFSVVFGKGQPFEGEAILPTLHQLSQLVSGVVETIEKGYSPR